MGTHVIANFVNVGRNAVANFRSNFHRVPNHILVIPGTDLRQEAKFSAEECAKQCYVEGPRCAAFSYDHTEKDKPICLFTSASVSGGSGLLAKQDVDVYEKVGGKSIGS